MSKGPDILNFYGRSHTAYLHPKGFAATKRLQAQLDCRKGESILEIGCGTGATLVHLAAIYKKTEFTGLERHATMYEKAKNRIGCCRLSNVKLIFRPGGQLPFPDGAFDKVYAESVLAIQEGDGLAELLAEIGRIVKPGGTLVFNEGIWTDHFGPEKIAATNARCKEVFGIIQANAQCPYLSDWERLLEQKGFGGITTESLEDVKPLAVLDGPWASRIASGYFSAYGKLLSIFRRTDRRDFAAFRTEMNAFSKEGKFLTSYLFKCYKIQ